MKNTDKKSNDLGAASITTCDGAGGIFHRDDDDSVPTTRVSRGTHAGESYETPHDDADDARVTMASARAMKRMQRDALEQAAEVAFGGGGGSDEGDGSEEEEEEEAVTTTRAPFNAFALLGGDDSDGDADEVRPSSLSKTHAKPPFPKTMRNPTATRHLLENHAFFFFFFRRLDDEHTPPPHTPPPRKPPTPSRAS